ncbi:hypothetical protein [Bacillus solimangrovi]|uniref:Alpha/beta hydrolase n=1 Tax=Bacillus solimangrovi TaxID=1305675 RepID=A0A1E5LHN0_9BACI|nr:hypothetical protein [Bacillus solimangrovi]OEH93594.1 hypothetical protein BFG57_00995 [Bacillus solimangrovi]
MNIEEKSLIVNGQALRYTHITQNNKTICFMFSGSGYTYEKPLLYYSTLNMLQNEVDVIHVHYSYSKNISFEEIVNAIGTDVQAVVNNVLANNLYTQRIFLGKSLGTIPIIQKFMNNEAFTQDKTILLTPLLNIHSQYERLKSITSKGMIVIGDKDPYFDEEKILYLKQHTSLSINIIPFANHALEHHSFDVETSIKNLQSTIHLIDSFIHSKTAAH